MTERGSFTIWQNGMTVAGGSGPLEFVKREAAHYALMYRQEGPIKVVIRRHRPRRKTVRELPTAPSADRAAVGDGENVAENSIP